MADQPITSRAEGAPLVLQFVVNRCRTFLFFFTALLSLINSLPPDEKLPVPPVAVVGRRGGKKRVDVKSAVRERSTSRRHLLSFSPDVTVQSLWITALKGRLSAKRLRLFVSAPFYAFEKKKKKKK